MNTITPQEQFADDQATISRLELKLAYLQELLAGKQELLDESMARNERLLERWEALLQEKEQRLAPLLYSTTESIENAPL